MVENFSTFHLTFQQNLKFEADFLSKMKNSVEMLIVFTAIVHFSGEKFET